MQLAVHFQIIPHFLWVLVLGVNNVMNECNFTRSQSALKHDTIDTYNIISTQNILQLLHNIQQVLTFYPPLVEDYIGVNNYVMHCQ